MGLSASAYAVKTAQELQEVLSTLLDTEVGRGKSSPDWPVVRADKNVYNEDKITLGRIPVHTARRLLAALRQVPGAPPVPPQR